MRTPESKIKQAILHPEEEMMREQALHYFSEFSLDDWLRVNGAGMDL